MSVIWSIVVVVVAAYIILGLTLMLMQSSFVFHPERELVCKPKDIGLNYEDVFLETNDGFKLSGWFIPTPNAKKTILFCHGNAGNISHRIDTLNIFNELGLNCLIFDYRGYGHSRGKPTEQGTYKDAAAAYTYLTEKKKIPPENIIIFGRSLGGSIAANLASTVNTKSLVLESTFTSYVDMAKKLYPYMPVKLFASFNYNTFEYIQQINCPVLIIHSREDEIVPFEFGLRLYDIASEPKEFVEIFGNHNGGFLSSGEIYTKAWSDWLEALDESEPVEKTLPENVP